MSSRHKVYGGKTIFFDSLPKEGCNRGHGLSAAIKLGTPVPKFLQSGRKLTCSQ